jgi:hypothetical protein
MGKLAFSEPMKRTMKDLENERCRSLEGRPYANGTWVLVPKNLESPKSLKPWATLAHGQAMDAPAKKSKTTSKVKTTKIK